MVITGTTRNRLIARSGPWVRIPPSPPEKPNLPHGTADFYLPDVLTLNHEKPETICQHPHPACDIKLGTGLYDTDHLCQSATDFYYRFLQRNRGTDPASFTDQKKETYQEEGTDRRHFDRHCRIHRMHPSAKRHGAVYRQQGFFHYCALYRLCSADRIFPGKKAGSEDADCGWDRSGGSVFSLSFRKGFTEHRRSVPAHRIFLLCLADHLHRYLFSGVRQYPSGLCFPDDHSLFLRNRDGSGREARHGPNQPVNTADPLSDFHIRRDGTVHPDHLSERRRAFTGFPDHVAGIGIRGCRGMAAAASDDERQRDLRMYPGLHSRTDRRRIKKGGNALFQ